MPALALAVLATRGMIPGDRAQSNARMSAPISPPPLKNLSATRSLEASSEVIPSF